MIGLAIAVANVDQIIEIIKSSKDPNEAKFSLLKAKWKSRDIKDLLNLVDDPRQIQNESEIYLTEDQSKAILELRLQRLTALGKDEIKDELTNLATQINNFLSILKDANILKQVIKTELSDVKSQFAIPRRTEINEGEVNDIDQEDLVQRSDMVVSVTNSGYVKRVPLSMYRACLLYTSPSPRD